MSALGLPLHRGRLARAVLRKGFTALWRSPGRTVGKLLGGTSAVSPRLRSIRGALGEAERKR
jgi:hypothetical protein